MKNPIQWKPATLAVVVLVFLSSAITVAGPASVLARAFVTTRAAASVTLPAAAAPATQQVIAALPPAGSAGGQAAALEQIVAPAIAASTQTPMPDPTTAPARPAATAVPAVSGLGGDTSTAASLASELSEMKALVKVASVAVTATSPVTATPAAATAASAPSIAATVAPASPASASKPAPTQAPAAQPGVPDRIAAPEIGLDSKIIPIGWREFTNPDGTQGAEWNVASYAVSWHKTSAPLGEPGNTVLTGHNNIEGEVFRHLEDLKIGDPITIYSGQQAFQYTVADKFILKEVGVPYSQRLENAKWIGSFPDERVTLMSCWPYTGDTHRIFIIAKPAPNS